MLRLATIIDDTADCDDFHSGQCIGAAIIHRDVLSLFLGDGFCDPTCNVFECNFDDGDCNLTTVSTYCASWRDDGIDHYRHSRTPANVATGKGEPAITKPDFYHYESRPIEWQWPADCAMCDPQTAPNCVHFAGKDLDSTLELGLDEYNPYHACHMVGEKVVALCSCCLALALLKLASMCCSERFLRLHPHTDSGKKGINLIILAVPSFGILATLSVFKIECVDAVWQHSCPLPPSHSQA